MTEQQLNTHIKEYLGKSYNFYKNAPKYLPYKTQITPMLFNDLFGTLYAEMLQVDNEYADKEDIIMSTIGENLIQISSMAKKYEQVRRVSKEVDRYISNNIVNQITSSKIYQIYEDNTLEMEPTHIPNIYDRDNIISDDLNVEHLIGSDSPIRRIYKVNYYTVNEFKNRIFKLQYNFKSERNIRYFECQFIFPKYHIDNIEFIDSQKNNISLIEDVDYVVEKLRDSIKIYLNDHVLMSAIHITYELDNIYDYVSFTCGYISNKTNYSEILETGIALDKGYDLLEFLGFPTYNYIVGRKYNMALGSVDHSNNKKVKTFRIIDDTTYDLNIVLYPKPDNVESIKIFTDYFNIANELDEYIQLVGENRLHIDKRYFTKHNVSIGTKLYIKYDSSDDVYKYMDYPHILERSTFNKIEKDIIVAEVNMVGSYDFYAYDIATYIQQKQLFFDTTTGDLGTMIPIYKNDLYGQDGTELEVIQELTNGNLYYYNEDVIDINACQTKYNYIPGTLKCFDEYGGEFKVTDWHDNRFGSGMGYNSFKISEDMNLSDLKNVTVRYVPILANQDIITNILNIRLSSGTFNVTDGQVVIPANQVVVDNYILMNWNFSDGIYSNPNVSDIIYEPFSIPDTTIESIEYTGSNYILGITTDSTSVTVQYHSDLACNLIINPAYTLHGYNPIVLLSEN